MDPRRTADGRAAELRRWRNAAAASAWRLLTPNS